MPTKRLATTAKAPSQLQAQISGLVESLFSWNRMQIEISRNPELAEVLRFTVDAPAHACSHKLRKLQGNLAINNEAGKKNMLMGPALTTKSFPRPTGVGKFKSIPKASQNERNSASFSYLELEFPLDCWVQLDLLAVSERISVDVGDGLLQLWSCNSVGSSHVLRVIDRRAVNTQRPTAECAELLAEKKHYPDQALADIWLDFDRGRFPERAWSRKDAPLQLGRILWDQLAKKRLGTTQLEKLNRLIRDPYLTTRPAGIPVSGFPSRWSKEIDDVALDWRAGYEMTSWKSHGLMLPRVEEVIDSQLGTFPDALWRGDEGREYKKKFMELRKLMRHPSRPRGLSCYLGGVPDLAQTDYRADWFNKGWRCLYNFDGPDEIFNFGDAGTGQIFYRKQGDKPTEFTFDWSCY